MLLIIKNNLWPSFLLCRSVLNSIHKESKKDEIQVHLKQLSDRYVCIVTTEM